MEKHIQLNHNTEWTLSKQIPKTLQWKHKYKTIKLHQLEKDFKTAHPNTNFITNQRSSQHSSHQLLCVTKYFYLSNSTSMTLATPSVNLMRILSPGTTSWSWQNFLQPLPSLVWRPVARCRMLTLTQMPVGPLNTQGSAPWRRT